MRLSVDIFFALLSGSIAAWLERQATARIEYLKAENRAVRSRLAGRRIIFTDAERRTLATLAHRNPLHSSRPSITKQHGVTPKSRQAFTAAGHHSPLRDLVRADRRDRI